MLNTFISRINLLFCYWIFQQWRNGSFHILSPSPFHFILQIPVRIKVFSFNTIIRTDVAFGCTIYITDCIIKGIQQFNSKKLFLYRFLSIELRIWYPPQHNTRLCHSHSILNSTVFHSFHSSYCCHEIRWNLPST